VVQKAVARLRDNLLQNTRADADESRSADRSERKK
jgi:hypothetical protein